MRNRASLLIIFLFQFATMLNAQSDSWRQQYLAELKRTGKEFANAFYPGYITYYSLSESRFISVIDSVRQRFHHVLDSYERRLSPGYVRGQQYEINYYFDKLLIDFPVNHANYTLTNNESKSRIPFLLRKNLADFNKVELLDNSDFTNYVKSFIAYEAHLESRKDLYRNDNNQQLSVTWKLLHRFISNKACLDYWQADYLYSHIDNDGIKGIASVYNDFKQSCKDTALLNKVAAIYREDSVGRTDHLMVTYKKAGPFDMDMHLFLPNESKLNTMHPVIVFFHGGSWSEGKPDWFFDACKSYAEKGWVACAVEYRTYGRHGTLPFDAVKDARSAIRWLRQHADTYHIDTNRIVASGNSAGGHLVLCAALAEKWNEKTDDLHYSPVPNVLLVNAGVYDLTDQNTAWIRKELKRKDQVKEISPLHLAKRDLPPTLIIHGTEDGNVPFATAMAFVDSLKQLGNTTLDFEALKGAGHFIWFDRKFSSQVTTLRIDFLKQLGY